MKKTYRILYTILLTSVLMFGFNSCFQDMNDDPAFNYPEMPIVELDYSPLKLDISFDNVFADASIYKFGINAYGQHSFVDGVNGKAYKGSSNSYVLAKINAEKESVLQDTISYFEGMTVAFWINTPKETGATGIFSIPHGSEFWGNFDIFQDNSGSASQTLYKIHLFDQNGATRGETWLEQRIDNGYNKWMHLAFTYDGEKSAFKIYKDGLLIRNETFAGFGNLNFDNVGNTMVIGTLPFQTTPSLTTGASAQDWARFFEGELDIFKFYNVALSAEDVMELYKENKAPEVEEPEEPEVGELSPENLKIFIPLDGNANAIGLYPFSSVANGALSFIDGTKGQAVQFASQSSYVLMNAGSQVDANLKDVLTNLNAYSVAMWLKMPKVTSAGSVFCIPNTATEFGNLDILVDNPWEDGKALFKVRMSNYASGALTDKWAEFKFDYTPQEWVHLIFIYDGEKSEMSLHKNGQIVNTLSLTGFGKLKFENMSSNVTLGAFQFNTSPSLTSVAAPDWAKWFEGSIDQFRFYNGVLGPKAIKSLYENKE